MMDPSLPPRSRLSASYHRSIIALIETRNGCFAEQRGTLRGTWKSKSDTVIETLQLVRYTRHEGFALDEPS